MRKDKIYELKISEEDDMSGIDSISLVDEPAIEVNWMFFNKTSQDFHIPEGQDHTYLEKIMGKGHEESELINDGWELHSMEVNGKEDFISSSPNDPSIEDEQNILVRYKYILNPEAPGAPIKETTREFCKDLLAKNLVFRVEDIEPIVNDEGNSALVWRGGYNCRHLWAKLKYKKDSKIVNKGSVTKDRVSTEDGGTVLGYPQPDTRVPEWPSFSKVGFEIGVPHYTKDGKLYEGPTHKDATGRLMTGAVHTKDSEYLYHQDELGYDVGGLPSYVDQVSGDTISKSLLGNVIECKECGHSWDMKDGGEKPYMCNKCGYDNKKEFESYSDYPDSVKNNAQAVLKWVEENGWGSCGTEVGKQRANQLAKGEPISEDTIQRMYSYLSRHKVDLDSSKSYDDGCGKLMYDSWGGLSALSWAESKINSFEKKNMSIQKFAIDSEEKRIVIGPAMIPDQNIFRKDGLGNPYYVYFSAETIKMIAEKYMKNKYTDNNDQMHNGMAVKDVYVVESWIKEDGQDKSNKYGYEDLPIGTWFVSMKIKNDEVWNKVKQGKLNGFSVSGYFEEVAAFCMEEMFLRQVAEILKNIED